MHFGSLAAQGLINDNNKIVTYQTHGYHRQHSVFPLHWGLEPSACPSVHDSLERKTRKLGKNWWEEYQDK